MSCIKRIAVVCALIGPVSIVAAQSAADLQGRWRLQLEPDGAMHAGLLEIEMHGGELRAFVDGGPASISLDGRRVEIDTDTRDGGGRHLRYMLSGELHGDAMSGALQLSGDGPSGTWSAERRAASAEQPPAPVDFSGLWSRASSGLAKVRLDYTAAGQAAVDGYHYLDDPALRCVSPGLVRISGWPYPVEIIQTGDQIAILYESFHEVRRIRLDGRPWGADLAPRAMGYSVGHWDGSTLVVETDRLSEAFVDLDGQPLSGDTRVVERMSLSDDGRTMYSEMTIHDPVNYNRPITRYRAWRRTPDIVILEYDCDPYPFFRGLQIEGTLQQYWDRMRRR